MTTKDYPIITFESQAAWEKWLEENSDGSDGLWLKMAKKETGIPSVTYAEALDVALCFGWIDGQKNKFDDQYWLQKFTPRRPRSVWSVVNKGKVAALIEAGKMREGGLKEIERAKADGRWEAAYESQTKIKMPEDLQKALDENPTAKAFFETLNSANRYGILYQVTSAKKAETRQRRIEKFIGMLNANEKLY
jgi:uncharacterized protein YdeI (YjbR/CyaY-like superfamily)